MIEELGAAPPTRITTDFKHSAGPLTITLGYMTFSHTALMLFAMEQWPGQEPRLWRKFWVTRQGAVRAALRLCADASQYLDMVTPRWRPNEDLDFSDFVEHLRLHVEGGMH